MIGFSPFQVALIMHSPSLLLGMTWTVTHTRMLRKFDDYYIMYGLVMYSWSCSDVQSKKRPIAPIQSIYHLQYVASPQSTV